MKMLLWYRRLEREAIIEAKTACERGDIDTARRYLDGVESLRAHYRAERIALVMNIGMGWRNQRK